MSPLDHDLDLLRERYGAGGFSVLDTDDDDPVLIAVDGSVVDTWREGYPYSERLSRESYEHHKRLLQIELLKLQTWSKATGGRHDQAVHGTPEPARGQGRRAGSPPTASSASGTSSATSTTCPRPGR